MTFISLTSTPKPRPRRVRPILLMALVVFLLDQWSKYWLLEVYAIAARAPVRLHENFALVMAWNKGVSFSMFAHDAAFMPYVLAGLAILISAVLLRMSLSAHRRYERLGFAMIIGGAIGNAVDRLRYGAVPDFFYAHIGDLGWPAFNVADMAICTGVGLLCIGMLKPRARA